MSQPSQALTASRPMAYRVLIGISIAHLLNDLLQGIIAASFPIYHQHLHLSYTQIGWVAFALNVTSSILQPFIGAYTDRRPLPFLLPLGMLFSLLGVIGLSQATSLTLLVISAALIGIGSSVLHPESSRVAHLAAGKGKGLAQSIFQVGGNSGTALAPIAVTIIVIPMGPQGLLWLTLAAAIGFGIQLAISKWYAKYAKPRTPAHPTEALPVETPRSGRTIAIIMLLVTLLFAKFVYIAAISGYYAFYYMERFQLPLESAQLRLFILQGAGILGTLLGGPLADRFGRKRVIFFSFAGSVPFALLLPYADPLWSGFTCFAIGLILMSGFSVIVVYAQDMLPGKVGMISGLFFGLAFGMAGLGSVGLGWLMDAYGVSEVFQYSALLPLLGLAAWLLPRDRA